MRPRRAALVLFSLGCFGHSSSGLQQPIMTTQTKRSETSSTTLPSTHSLSDFDPPLQEDSQHSVAPSRKRLRLWAERGGSAVSTPNKLVPRELFAEALGTFLIVFWGTGSVFSAVTTGSLVGVGQVAAVWSVAVTAAILVTGPISGAHLNPAMTLSFALLRKFEWRKVLPYVLAQLVGAVIASALNWSLYSNLMNEFELAQGLTRATSMASAKCFGEYYLSPVTAVQALFAEAIGTAVLAGVVFGVTHRRNQANQLLIAPTIGATVGALIGVLAPVSQAGFNPARDFGPRIVAYLAGWTQVAFSQAWVFIVGPLMGAPIGAWIVEKLLEEDS